MKSSRKAANSPTVWPVPFFCFCPCLPHYHSTPPGSG